MSEDATYHEGMSSRILVFSLSLVLGSLIAGTADVHAAGEAVRELGQPSFRAFMPNRLDARGLSQPWGERPLSPGAHSRQLIDLSTIEENYYFTPYGLATDSASRIYLTAGNHVYRFPRNGGSPSLRLGEPCVIGYSTGVPEALARAALCGATGLAVGPGGDLFVSDAGAHRIVVFDIP